MGAKAIKLGLMGQTSCILLGFECQCMAYAQFIKIMYPKTKLVIIKRRSLMVLLNQRSLADDFFTSVIFLE